MSRIRMISGLALALGLVLTSSAVLAKTTNVPTDYATIQGAIDAAANGDDVVVAKGRHKENIDFKDKAITVRSTDPNNATVVAATIIDGDKKGSVVTFKSGEKTASILSGFTITAGSALFGGGVSCFSSSPTITSNAITDKSATGEYGSGGGVFCYSCSPTITNNTITGNSATNQSGSGGGVYCTNNSSPAITENTIADNKVRSRGGGVYCDNHSSPALTSNIISGNGAVYDGGGVYCSASSPTLTKNTINGNKAASGGGVFCSSSSPTLTTNNISGNSADRGGGVYCSTSSPTLTDNMIGGNSVSDEHGSGGGVFCGLSSSPVLTNNIISGNSVIGEHSGGGGVYCHNASPIIANATISGNSADSGGGIFCEWNSSPTVTNTIVSLNTGGGGLYAKKVPSPSRSSRTLISTAILAATTSTSPTRPASTATSARTRSSPMPPTVTSTSGPRAAAGGREPTPGPWTPSIARVSTQVPRPLYSTWSRPPTAAASTWGRRATPPRPPSRPRGAEAGRMSVPTPSFLAASGRPDAPGHPFLHQFDEPHLSLDGVRRAGNGRGGGERRGRESAGMHIAREGHLT